MKFNFNQPLLNLKGEPQKQTLGEILGDFLSTEPGKDGTSIKLYDYAVKLAKGEVINMDRSDKELVRKLVNETERMVALIKAQILIVIDGAVEEA